MALDPDYVIAPSLEMYFVNKDDGTPLSNGKVYFYEDEARTIPKPVFQLSGSPPNYSYTVLPNPSILSSVGTFQDDSGNDIIPYYFPFDDAGNVQLYYIEVYSQDDVLQFTREGWPNFTDENVITDDDITNFVPNGQFLLHNSSDPTEPLSGPQVMSTLAYGGTIGTLEVYEIAQGGWTFERNNGSTATDSVTFPSYTSVTTPTGNPRFAVSIATTVAGSDTAKDLCLKFPGVNTFASDSQPLNLYFEAESGTGSNIAGVQIIIRKYFGAGGSASTETVVSTITLTPSIQKFNTTLLFGTNTNKTLGTGGDDFVQIVLRLPPTGVQTGIFTDFALTLNDTKLTAFPTQTEAQQLAPSTAGFLPVPDPLGSDLYLPIILTSAGFDYDTSPIGEIVASTSVTPAANELICNGTTYLTSGYSTVGIPYSRLQAKLFNGTVPLYGTGSAFVTTYVSTGLTTNIIFSTNTFGSSTAPANGSSSPAFTFTNIHTPASTNFGINAHQNATAGIICISNALGSVTAPAAGTSGFTVSDIRNNADVSTFHIFSITTISGAAMAAGTYFTFTALNPGVVNYYMWFKKDGAGADPAPGGTGIEVDILSTMSAQDIAVVVTAALNAGRQTVIGTVAASAITGGNYFTFGTPNANLYYVWYKKDGSGTDPDPASTTLGIQVNILAADTAAQVATKTVAAINAAYFAVPDLRGLFLRGYDPTNRWDLNAATRWGDVAGIFGNALGTFEYDTFLSHRHTSFLDLEASIGAAQSIAANQGVSQFITLTTQIGPTGQLETRPVNANVYWMIKY